MATRFETTDLEVAHHLLVNTYGKPRLTVDGDRHFVRVSKHR
ncbi:hypothetical protein [Phytohabitans kaempferiae]|uniref:Uncharacterized protein n=1 Tax=Phytohabitans kaempferiae TaxID=1620943 RepID=A0ABV6LYP5_9ACTN